MTDEASPESVERDLRGLVTVSQYGDIMHMPQRQPKGPSTLHPSFPYPSLGSNKQRMAVMSESSSEQPQETAANACIGCRSQKRKCDKTLPSCSRCVKMKVRCNYKWAITGTQVNPYTSLSDFLLFHVPVTGDNLWLPGTFQPLQPCWQSIHSRRLDIDQFFVGLLMTTLVEQRESANDILRLYFTNIHTWLPIVHNQTFQSRLSQMGDAPTADTALILFAMLLLMKGTESREGNSRSGLYLLCSYHFSFIQLVRGPTVELVQAGLLLAVYELGSGRSQAASLTIGTCARLGYILRLNIDDQVTPQDSSWVKAEEQRRVWMGIYLLDRLIHQVETNVFAPHAVDEPAAHFRLPFNDPEWERCTAFPSPGPFQPDFSTPIDVPLAYFAREIQAVRILGQVQLLPKISNQDMFHQQINKIDAFLMQLMERLFEQTPGSWEVLCGANANALMAAITLHRTRLNLETQIHPFGPSTQQTSERSIFALCSIIGMVREICLKFNALDERSKIRWVPLPAVICTGEAAKAAVWLNQIPARRTCLDIEPLRETLRYSARSWKLAEEHLRQIAQLDTASLGLIVGSKT
ncbi:hypothetical protein BDV12DRAFT_180989 [Aspergillus spectabilis]